MFTGAIGFAQVIQRFVRLNYTIYTYTYINRKVHSKYKPMIQSTPVNLNVFILMHIMNH